MRESVARGGTTYEGGARGEEAQRREEPRRLEALRRIPEVGSEGEGLADGGHLARLPHPQRVCSWVEAGVEMEGAKRVFENSETFWGKRWPERSPDSGRGADATLDRDADGSARVVLSRRARDAGAEGVGTGGYTGMGYSAGDGRCRSHDGMGIMSWNLELSCGGLVAVRRFCVTRAQRGSGDGPLLPSLYLHWRRHTFSAYTAKGRQLTPRLPPCLEMNHTAKPEPAAAQDKTRRPPLARHGLGVRRTGVDGRAPRPE